jgi:TolB-like protein
MKRCPECRRDYHDETLLYCLEDGVALVQGSVPASTDESATAILSEPGAVATGFPAGESPTRPQIHTTDRTAIFPHGVEAKPHESFGSSPERQSLSAHRAAEPQEERSAARALKPLLLVSGVAIIVLGSFFGYRYFNVASSDAIRSIAVLPFENRSSDADTDYLSDGLAESLIFRLTQLPDLKVSPTSSVMRYKGNETDVTEIARELGVEAVMTGRLTKRGDNLNITVELVDVRSNKSLWGERYERKMTDLLATQREIAATIVQKLQLKLSGDEKGVTKKYTDSNEAYQLWLKARYHFTKRTGEDLRKSIEIYEEAVKLDPEFALAYVGIAESWTVIPSFPYGSPADCMPKAKAAAEKALQLDPELPEAHTVSAMIAATYDWDWKRAEAGFKRAIELDPNVSIAHYRYAWTLLCPLGRHDEAIAEMKIAMEKEPLYLIQGANYAAVLMYARRFDEAVEQAKKTYDLDPNFIGSKNWLGHTYAAKGQYAEALAIVEKSLDAAMPLRTTAGYAFAKTGRRDKALAQIEQYKQAEKQRYVQNYWIAINYAALGDKDAAFAELEKAYKHHDWFMQKIKVDPFMDPLRDDPRFDELVKRMNFPK